jgi:hypothetical protein
VPPGIADATVPNPVFNLTPTATVDEGNNWVNISWGPLALTNPAGMTLGNYGLQMGSPAIDAANGAVAPNTDFFGKPRPQGPGFDIGAVEFAEVTLSPKSLTFGNQLVTTTSGAQTVTLYNFPSTPLTGIAISASGDFAVAGTTCGATLPAGGSCTISVTFSPTARGVRTGMLSVADSAGTQTASLSGTGVAPNAAVSTGSLSFPNTNVGSTSAAMTVTLSNLAPANLALTINSVTFGGTNPGDFVRTTGANNCGTTLAVGASCNIYLQFKPTYQPAFPRAATLVIASNDPFNPTLTTNLSGTALEPINSVSPLSLTFSSPLNVTSAPQSVTVTNTGNAPLRITNIVLAPGSQYAETSNCPLNPSTLGAGASCTINVTFTPTTATPNPKNSNFNVNVAAPATGVTVSLTGNVTVPSASLTPNPAAFGSQQVGTTSAAHAFTYTNTGTTPITVSNTGVTLGGSTASNYSIASNTCIVSGVGVTLAAGATCQIGVTFTPSATGSRAATLTVIDTAGGAPNQTANLTGTGVAPSSTLTGTAAFGNQQVGTTSAPHTFTFANTGIGPFTVTTVSLSGGQANNYAIVSNGCTGNTVPAGGSCTFGVTFTPSATGGRTTTLTATGASGGATTTHTAPLGGTGVAPSSSLTGTAAFGNQQLNLTSAPHTLTFNNTGSGPITVSSVALSGGNANNYAIVSNLCTGATLVAGGNCAIGVTFTPSALGSRTASLTVMATSGSSTTSSTASLTPSTGVQGAEFTSATLGTLSFVTNQRTLAFGNLSGAQTSVVTVTVVGPSAVTFISPATVSNGTGTAFSKGADTCSGMTVAAGGTCTITINFAAPSGNSSRTGTLSVPDNTTGSPQSLSLTGS